MFVLPSIYRNEIPHARMTFGDWYFILTLYLLPTCFIGFLPDKLIYVQGFFDYRLLTLLMALLLPLLGPRFKSRDFWNIPGIKILWILSMTVFMRAIWTYYQGTSLFEIVAVLRWNLIWPIYALCILHYASRLPCDRLYAIFRIYLILFSVHVFLATISLVTNIDFFLNKNAPAKQMQFIEGGLPVTNLKAFPMHIFTGTAFLFILFLRAEGQRLKYLFFFVAFALPFLFTRRMYSIIVTFQSAVIYFLTVFVRTNKAIFRTPIILICVLMIFYAMQPIRFDKWIEKVSPAIEEGIAPENIATYVFRGKLLVDAFESVAENKTLFVGNGYEREYNILRDVWYSYAQGEDAPIASVVFCEGVGGLFLRILPYFILLWFNLKRLIFNNELNMRLYSCAVIGVIVSQIPAYLQTQAITHFEYFYVPFAIVELIILKLHNINYSPE